MTLSFMSESRRIGNARIKNELRARLLYPTVADALRRARGGFLNLSLRAPMLYLSIKSLHIILVTSWFAGLFYLPRLFVNHAMVSDKATLERLALMEHKLYRFMTPLGILAVGLGMWLWFGFGFSGGWLHLKTALVTFLIVYHLYCGRLMRAFAEGATPAATCGSASSMKSRCWCCLPASSWSC
jgi:putative membrane protein